MQMEKSYNHKEAEEKIYKMWEECGYFTPTIDKAKKPFTILLPLPNANDPMHMGHALFTIQDILIRYHRMRGDPTLWLPGGDHAGIETQFVFEKYLSKQGKSRFDFDRNTLYKLISDFANQYKDVNKSQMKQLGFSLDWTRYHYSMEPEIVERVFDTFRSLCKDNLIYRAERLVNYCTHCGTAFSDLEVEYVERHDPLYYIKYGPFVLATTRPETKFGDTAVAVNPKDPRYKSWIGKEFIYNSLAGEKKLGVIGDSVVDMNFGTGVVKVTPAHDPNDYDLAKRHNLPFVKVIDRFGKLTDVAGRFAGFSIKRAREEVVKALGERGDVVKIDNNYSHRIGLCYRCGNVIEPLLTPQWYLKTKPLAKKAIASVKKGETTIAPKKRFEKMYFDWLEKVEDWNISRQIVWGPQIPAWYCLDCNKSIALGVLAQNGAKHFGTYQKLTAQGPKLSFLEIKKGLQWLSAPVEAEYFLDEVETCPKCKGRNILQETDTFDTWFLSGQWPLTTLGYPDSPDFKYFYPTSILDTLWDILFFWVARMMMLGIYRTKKAPFKIIHLHSRVVDKQGRKMSKSKGNVVNPIDMVEKYGADALRMSLIYGIAPASDIVVTEEKIKAMRNFANKVWNMGRFILLMLETFGKETPFYSKDIEKQLKNEDREIIRDLDNLIVLVNTKIAKFRFADAGEGIYHFMWHELADKYIELIKNREDKKVALSVLRHVYITCLKLLHPFMPFVTEDIWEKIPRKQDKPLIISPWPR